MPLRRLFLLAALVLASGCAGRVRWEAASDGQLWHDRAIRQALVTQRYGQAWELARQPQTAAGDALLASMQRGVTAYWAGDRSAAATQLSLAHLVAEDRWTKSVSRAAGSMLSGDGALAYEATPTERWFIPLYAAMAFTAAGDPDAAAVEARRLAGLLQRADQEGDGRRAREVRAALRYVSGALFEAAGDPTDAEVAYRNAWRLAGDRRLFPDADSLAWRAPLPVDSGEVVVVIERGQAGYLVEQGGRVWMDDDDLRFFRDRDDAAQRWGRARRVSERMNRQPARGITGLEWISVRYPAVAGTDWATGGSLPFAAASGPFAILASASLLAAPGGADVASAWRADWEAEQPARIARAVGRAAIRLAAMHAGARVVDDARDETGKKRVAMTVLGAGLFAWGIGADWFDRADTRSWSVLPARLELRRVRLAAGRQPLTVEVGGRSLAVGMVDVPAGRTTLAHAREWGGGGGGTALAGR